MKNVSFKRSLCVVHYIDLKYESEMYKEARNGQVWINHAIDRCRFKNRINTCKNVIDKILADDHRSAVFKQMSIVC